MSGLKSRGKTESQVSQIHQVFSKTNSSHNNWNATVCIQQVATGFTKSSGLSECMSFYTFSKEGGSKKISEPKAGKPYLVEVRFLIYCKEDKKSNSYSNSKKGWDSALLTKNQQLGTKGSTAPIILCQMSSLDTACLMHIDIEG